MINSPLAQQTPLDALYQSAAAMLEHNEFDAAEALLQVIVKRDPHYAPAREMLHALKPVPMQKHYVDYDYHTGMYEVLDENDERIKAFVSREEAERFARSRN